MPGDGLAGDVLSGTAKAMPHVRSLSFSTALYFKAPASFASFLPCTTKYKSSHKKHTIKMWETKFLLHTTLGNYNNMLLLFLNKLNVQSLIRHVASVETSSPIFFTLCCRIS